MKTTKKAALAAASSALLLGLTVAQTVNADTYTVQNGDSFFGIASQYGVDPYQLAAENGMTIWSTIVPGGSLEAWKFQVLRQQLRKRQKLLLQR